MKKLILAIFLTLTVSNISYAVDGVELQEVYVNYKSFEGDIRSPYLDVPGLEGHTLQSELNLNVNMDIFDHLYFNNTIHSLNDGSYRLIGWNWRFGIHVTDWLDFGWNHFSEHYTDFQSPYGFPLQNSWEVNVYIYRRKNLRKGLF